MPEEPIKYDYDAVYREWSVKMNRLQAENEMLRQERDEAREAALWLFIHGDTDWFETEGATKDWPWLDDTND